MVLSVRRIPSSWLLPSGTAKELQSDDAACIGDHRRLNVRLGLVIEQACDVEGLMFVGIECDRSVLWPLLKVMVSSFVAEVVFTRLTPVHQSASEAMCEI